MAIVRPIGLGVAVPLSAINHSGEIIQQEIDLLAPAWWMNWSYQTYGASTDRFVPMVWSDYWNEAAMYGALLELPGRTWLIHNEPHRADQANMTPAEAAADVRRFMSVAWKAGVEFQAALGGCGINESDYDGIAWMREFIYLLRRTGLPRSSYWHIHGYRSTSVVQMRAGWERWQRLADEVGLDAPVVLSEFCAENASPLQQMLVMDETARWISDGKIVGAAWFATHGSSGVAWPNCRLTDHLPSGEIVLTEIGRHWKMLAAA